MALDPYASCPCGSGKKFKWCCQPIHVEIDRAFRQDADGQRDSALRIMDEVVAEHPTNSEAWGRKAQLLYQNDRVEDAENALQKAFEINPNYAFGNLLRGMFRFHEGEATGALLLFRKAAEAYDPEARDALGQVYAMIFDCEMKQNRPVAGRAALRIAVHCTPSNEELRNVFDQNFGDKSRLPLSGRQEYKLQGPAAGTTGERRAAWDRALAGESTARLSDIARAFESLSEENAGDAAAWYNLGVTRAWLGDNAGALEALDRYVNLETDENQAAAAWALGEVLRCGQGMEDQADYYEYSVSYRLQDPRAALGQLERWEKARRLVGVQADEQQGILSAMVLDEQPTLAGAITMATKHLGAYLLLYQNVLRLWGSNKEAFGRVHAELREQAGPGLAEMQERVQRVLFGDVVSEAMAFPMDAADENTFSQRAREHAQHYFEEVWIHRPLRSLNMIPPIDAGGHGNLRKKLAGVVRFLQECSAIVGIDYYDFERLRRKLGLLSAPGETPSAATGTPPALDVTALGAAELAGLTVADLSDEQIEQAYQTAVKLDAHELAGRFARSLVDRPPNAARPDRYPWYTYLVQRALLENKTDDALNYVNEGEKADCEHNEGRRRNDYELRRAQIHARRGDADQANEVFERLVERSPAELRYRGSAAEAMLSLRQGARALRFAEEGLVKARAQNNRDSEQYFLELVSAAKKQG